MRKVTEPSSEVCSGNLELVIWCLAGRDTGPEENTGLKTDGQCRSVEGTRCARAGWCEWTEKGMRTRMTRGR